MKQKILRPCKLLSPQQYEVRQLFPFPTVSPSKKCLGQLTWLVHCKAILTYVVLLNHKSVCYHTCLYHHQHQVIQTKDRILKSSDNVFTLVYIVFTSPVLRNSFQLCINLHPDAFTEPCDVVVSRTSSLSLTLDLTLKHSKNTTITTKVCLHVEADRQLQGLAKQLLKKQFFSPMSLEKNNDRDVQKIN